MAIGFSEAELARVPQAIEKAERETRAEIFAVLAERSDTYRFVAYSFLALWILIFSAILALWLEWQIIRDATNSWGDQVQINAFLNQVPMLVFAQIAAFLTGMLCLRLFPSLAVAITPRRIAHERARANGIKQFLAHGIHKTAGRSGVLVFVSLDERYGEIFVDAGVEAKIGKEFFLEEVAVLIENCEKGKVIDGYVEVISAIGEKLALEMPIEDGDENELENRFIVL